MSISNHPVDVVDECSIKLSLLSDLLNHSHPDCQVDLSPQGLAGLSTLLLEIETDLRRVCDNLCAKPKEVSQ